MRITVMLADAVSNYQEAGVNFLLMDATSLHIEICGGVRQPL